MLIHVCVFKNICPLYRFSSSLNWRVAFVQFLASQDAQEVMRVTESLGITGIAIKWLANFTDMTLVNEDAFEILD